MAETVQLLCLPLYLEVDEGDVLTGQLLETTAKNLQDIDLRMLNLSRHWLNSLLPHVLQKVNRVG